MDLVERPYAMLAELTYRCPLHCPYCSNPVRSASQDELNMDQWARVIREAANLVLWYGVDKHCRSRICIWL
jgi:pyrroloquinoline quinone biosynthesis protein E